MKQLFSTLLLLMVFVVSKAQIDILNGLQARYLFNGNANDATDNHYDGTLHGSAYSNGYRLVLNNTSHDYLSVPSTVLNGLGDFSITFQVAFAGFHLLGENPTNQVLCAWGSELNQLGVAYNKPTNSWIYTFNGVSNSVYDPNVDPESIFCMFMVRQSDSLKVYIDANLIAEWEVGTDPISIDSLVVGQLATCHHGCFSQNQCTHGHVEDLAFWNRAVNADEIDLACHNPYASFISSSFPCADGIVDFTNLSEHANQYFWDFGDGNTSTEFNPTHQYSSSGTYDVTLIATNQWNAISDTFNFQVEVSTNLSASASADGSTTFCEGGSVSLTANSGNNVSYQWMKDGNQINGATDADYTATSSGFYSVLVTANGGCSAESNEIAVTVNANPDASITPDGSVGICEGGIQIFTANSGDFTYQWLSNGNWIGGATNSFYDANSSGNYSVIVWNSNGCSATSSSSDLTVNSNPAATIDPSGAVSFCEGGNQVYNANTGNLTYQWTLNGIWINGATNSSYEATSSGNYAVIVWNASGCSATSSSSELTENSVPEATIDPSDAVSFCEGGSQVYNANSGDLTYQWTSSGDWINGATNSSYEATTSGNYAVIVWNSNGCSATSASSELTVNANPDASIDPSEDIAICAGSSQLYTANSGDLTYQWLWNGNAINGATNSSYEASSEGSYAVIVWNSSGCSATSSSSDVTVNPLPEVSLGSDTTVCDTSNYILDAGAGFESYLWNDNTTDQTHEVTESGTYSVQVTDNNGCVGSASVDVTVTICTGIPILALESAVEIFPNPNFGTFAIEINMPREDHVTIDLTNLVGQVVLPIYDGQLSGQFAKEVDAHSLAKAVYFVQMRFANKVITKKVVISE